MRAFLPIFIRGAECLAVFDEVKFLKEAEGLVKIKHINIIKTSGVLVNQIAFVQEFCLQKTGEQQVHFLSGLLSYLKDKISEKFRLMYFCHITNALQFLHSVEIVVGDLKPGNVLVTSDISRDWIFKLGDICPETRKRNDCSAAMSSCVSAKDSFVYTAALHIHQSCLCIIQRKLIKIFQHLVIFIVSRCFYIN